MASDDIERLAAGMVRFTDETRGSSALYTALSPRIARDQELLGLLLAASPAQRRANLLFAAVHCMLLAGGDHALACYYPSVADVARAPDEGAFPAFRDFCLSRREQIGELVATRRTQTNEVRRSAAFLPAFQRLSEKAPLALVEVGSSAGLNLLVDRYAYRYGSGPWLGDGSSSVRIQCETKGEAPPASCVPPSIGHRIGIDGDPLDICKPEDARWLKACVWPDQADRHRLLQDAIDVARTAPPGIVKGSAVETIGKVVGEIPDGQDVCLFHSATLAYFGDEELSAFIATLDRLGSRRRLHWLSFEGGGSQSFGARLPFGKLDKPRPEDRPTDIMGLLGYATWSDGSRSDRLLARVDMHGRWIEWIDRDF